MRYLLLRIFAPYATAEIERLRTEARDLLDLLAARQAEVEELRAQNKELRRTAVVSDCFELTSRMRKTDLGRWQIVADEESGAVLGFIKTASEQVPFARKSLEHLFTQINASTQLGINK